MAKVIIKLDLNKDKDLREYNLYNNVDGMFDALSEISQKLKKESNISVRRRRQRRIGLGF